jgi:hypothetical protein
MPAAAVLIDVEQDAQGIRPAKTNKEYGIEPVSNPENRENIKL